MSIFLSREKFKNFPPQDLLVVVGFFAKLNNWKNKPEVNYAQAHHPCPEGDRTFLQGVASGSRDENAYEQP